MTVQTQLLIPQQFVGRGKLVQNVVPVVLAVFCQAGGVEGHPHVQAVQPDLIRIDVLVPEVPGDGTGVVRQNAVGALHALCPPCLPGNTPVTSRSILMDLPKLTLSMLCSPGTQFATLPASSIRKEEFRRTGSRQLSLPVAQYRSSAPTMQRSSL